MGQHTSLKAERTERWPLVVLAVLPTLWFARTWQYPYTNWDDFVYIVHNPLLQDASWAALIQIFQPGKIDGELLYIPIAYASFWLEARFGGLDAGTTHLVNTLLHSLNAVLLYCLLGRWTRAGSRVAFLTACAFAIHPLQVEAVAWCMGRKDLLACGFALLSLLVYDHSRAALSPTRQRRGFALTLLAFALAVLAKPTALVLPLLWPLCDRLSQREHWRRPPYVFWLGIVIALATFAINREVGTGASAAPHGWYFLAPTVNDWLLRVFAIQEPNVFYSTAAAAAPERLVLYRFAAVAVLIVTWLWAWRRGYTKIWTPMLMSALTFLPAASIVLNLDREFITADRYGYLPLVFFYFAIANVPENLSHSRRVAAAVLTAVVLVAGWRSQQQIAVWQDSQHLWQQALQHDPHNGTAANSLGNHFADTGEWEKAAIWYRRAAGGHPGKARAHYNLGRTRSALGDVQGALQAYGRALFVQPTYHDAAYNSAVLYFRQGQLDAATGALAKVADAPETFYLRGRIAQKQGRMDEAKSAYERAIAQDPEHVDALFKLAVLNLQQQQVEDGLKLLGRTVALNPNHGQAHYNLGMIFASAKAYPRAEQHLRQATTILSPDPDPPIQLARVLVALEQTDAAVAVLHDAATAAPHDSQPHVELAKIHTLLGNTAKAAEHSVKAQALQKAQKPSQ